MNRTDRLLAIVLELQRHGYGYYRAEDLAATFEVSKRTIYRDIQALSEAGVPIAAVARQGYTLAEGYFLPPVSFTSDEALILALGSDFMANNFDDQYRVAAHSAYRKIDAVLSTALRNQVDELKDRFQFFVTKPLDDDQLRRLHELRWAVAEQRRVRLRYSRREQKSNTFVQTVREVDPYHLTRLADDWYLTAYCHLRQSVRVFRLARIDKLAILESTFERPIEGGADWVETRNGQLLFVQALFDREVARGVLESFPYSIIEEEEVFEGLRITLMAQSENDILKWLLSWGGQVCVLEPAWLQTMLVRHAERMLKNYSPILVDD